MAGGDGGDSKHQDRDDEPFDDEHEGVSYSRNSYHAVCKRGARRSCLSAVTSFKPKAMAVAAMIRSAGSPGTAPSKEPATSAISALTGSQRSSGKRRTSASHCSAGTASPRLPPRISVAISN